MARIRDTSRSPRVIVRSHTAEPLVFPDELPKALGAEAYPHGINDVTGPMTLALLRAEFGRRLTSTGGRPGLEGVSTRKKVPLSDDDWRALETIAAKVARPGVNPTAGQVASVLIGLSIRDVLSKLESGSGPDAVAAAIADALAARADDAISS